MALTVLSGRISRGGLIVEVVEGLGQKIISISEVKHKYEHNRCRHRQIVVDEDLLEVECGTCGKKLNPITILARFAQEESYWGHRLEKIKEFDLRFSKKKKTKCRHCNKFTEVNW